MTKKLLIMIALVSVSSCKPREEERSELYSDKGDFPTEFLKWQNPTAETIYFAYKQYQEDKIGQYPWALWKERIPYLKSHQNRVISYRDLLKDNGSRWSLPDKSIEARIQIRANLYAIKHNLVFYIGEFLRRNPPRSSESMPSENTPENRMLIANEFADRYIIAVDEFLRTHPGANPKQGTRNFVLDATGVQNDTNHPWCATWAADMSSKLMVAANWNAKINMYNYIRIYYVQYHSYFGYQHNYVILTSYGNKPNFENGNLNFLAIDPWREILPKIYKFTSKDDKFYPSNYGIE